MFISAACEKKGRMALKKKHQEIYVKVGYTAKLLDWFNVIESFSGWHVSGQTGGLWDFQEGLL